MSETSQQITAELRRELEATNYDHPFIWWKDYLESLITRIENMSNGGSQTSTSVTLTSAQLLALHDTPVTVVAAPSVASYIVPVRAFYVYRFVTTPYVTTDTTCEVRFQGGTTPLMLLYLFVLNETADFANSENEGQGQPYPLSEALGKALQLKCPNANPTDGDGTLEITVEYVTITP